VVAFLHGGSPFKVWQPDSFRIRLNRRSTFNYGWDILYFSAKSHANQQGGVMRGFVFVLITVGILISAQAKTGWADIIDTSSTANLWGVGTIAVSASAPGGSQASVSWCAASGCFSSGPTLSFNPPTLSYEGASASETANVTYTGSGLTASGSGAASGANPNAQPYAAQPSSGFDLWITPDVNVSYQLSGDLQGDIVTSGDLGSGSVFLTQFPPAPGGWTYIMAPATTPTSFDLSGTMYSGDAYNFSIGVEPGAPYAPPDTYNANWDFSLTIGSQADLTATPEPASLILLGTGLAGLAAGLRRKRNSQRREASR
jgi:hypothetical protein